MPERRLAAYTMMVLAGVLGWGSLLLFMGFLCVGSLNVVDLAMNTRNALFLDAGLCLLFFVQHSVMVRKSYRRWQARRVPAEYGDAVYAICSSLVLLALVVFWQRSEQTIVVFGGACRVPFHALFLLSVAGFAWGIRSFRHFDPFGMTPVRHRLRGTQPRPQPFVAVGPYRWVRHPLYLFMLLMIWSCPALTMDRLLFNLLWTGWICVVGTILEERDLVSAFGDTYRQYQREVPMLIPYRRPQRVASLDRPSKEAEPR